MWTLFRNSMDSFHAGYIYEFVFHKDAHTINYVILLVIHVIACGACLRLAEDRVAPNPGHLGGGAQESKKKKKN